MLRLCRHQLSRCLWPGLAAGIVLVGCTLEPEADAERPLVEPRLVTPLEVYPGQVFVIDASGSDFIGPGRIDGYEFVFDRGDDVVRTSEPRLEHRFDSPGVHIVGLRLVGHEPLTEQTVRVVDCEAVLGCEPTRPCPPWYACDNGRCVAAPALCEADAECPGGLPCVAGACGAAGTCGL